jgi:hypothetical protein
MLTADPIAETKEQLAQFIPAFVAGYASPQLVIELRAIEVPQRYGPPKVEAGFFDLMDPALKAAFWDAVRSFVSRPSLEQPEGVYVTVNPVSPALLARANGRLKVAGRRGALSCSDKDVLVRRWLPIDVDPVRPIAGISATDEEKSNARRVIDGVREDLRARGFPDPIFTDSGNGFHAWYPIDPPADDKYIEEALKGIAARHDAPDAKVDTTVFNPSRIMKLPGTWARKGDPIPDRPHRMARVLEVPAL